LALRIIDSASPPPAELPKIAILRGSWVRSLPDLAGYLKSLPPQFQAEQIVACSKSTIHDRPSDTPSGHTTRRTNDRL
jgi:hypothetical protein